MKSYYLLAPKENPQNRVLVVTSDLAYTTVAKIQVNELKHCIWVNSFQHHPPSGLWWHLHNQMPSLWTHMWL
ncbi:hypothetical protein Pmani_028651 [Petrolisthes manimaculis]|uniref:Uncharacterized protein n=1 Tax=Petrolisthes manimaculis TaxID=1843537 RepID=A0AAE1TVG7_9EUCA|nr:hypothetical protein Pmani_028651 [Petrolisthes manimaculis]